MADKTEPKKINNDVMGKVSQKKTTNHGDKHSGPSTYHQAKIGGDFMVHDAAINKQNVNRK